MSIDSTDQIPPIDIELASDKAAPDGTPKGEIVIASEVLPLTLHLLPLEHRPFFPIQTFPLAVEEQPWLETVKAITDSPQKVMGLVFVEPGEENPPSPERFEQVGTVVKVRGAQRQDGNLQLIVEGLQRFRIERWVSKELPYVAQVRYLEDELHVDNDETRAFGMAILSTLKELIPLNPLYNEELKLFLQRFSPNQPSFLSYFAANLTTASAKTDIPG